MNTRTRCANAFFRRLFEFIFLVIPSQVETRSIVRLVKRHRRERCESPQGNRWRRYKQRKVQLRQQWSSNCRSQESACMAFCPTAALWWPVFSRDPMFPPSSMPRLCRGMSGGDNGDRIDHSGGARLARSTRHVSSSLFCYATILLDQQDTQDQQDFQRSILKARLIIIRFSNRAFDMKPCVT